MATKNSPKRPRPMKQIGLPAPRTWGGRRANAGRKRRRDVGVAHVARPAHHRTHPVHVTLKIVPGLLSLRNWRVFEPIRDVIAQASRPGYAIIHFSVMGDHLHLLVEAADKIALSKGMRSLDTRLAQVINRALKRKGLVLAERYHARALRHPREVRRALVYVLLNWRKHFDKRGVDDRSSGPWFDGWKNTEPISYAPSPVAAATTWLLLTGWRAGGLIDPEREAPATGPRRSSCMIGR